MQCLLRDSYADRKSRCRTGHIHLGHCIDELETRRLEASRGITRNCFTFRSEFLRQPTSGRVFIMNERMNKSISLSIFNATKAGNGLNNEYWQWI